MTRSLRFRIILLSLFLLCLTRLGYAQGDTARLQGTITDAQGAAVEGANLTVTNTGTGRTVSVRTNDLGYLYADGNIVFGAPGTAGRNILRGPGSSNLDFAIFKNLSVTERIKVELRGQAYNLTNTPHFGNPNGNLGSWNTQNCNATPSNQPCVLVNGVSKQLVPNPNQQFGQVSSTVPFSYRQVELGLRVTF